MHPLEPRCRARIDSRWRSQVSAPTSRPASSCRWRPRLSINVVLTVGSLEESVTVEGAAPLVDVKSAGISDVVRNEEIVTLPLNGRNPRRAGDDRGRRRPDDYVDAAGAPGSLGVSVAGGQSFGVAYVLDGAMHNNPQDNLNMPFPFPTRCRSSASPPAA